MKFPAIFKYLMELRKPNETDLSMQKQIANSSPDSALINRNTADLKWSNSEFTLTLQQQNRLFAPLPHVFWSFIRLCKQSLLKWKASRKCWASLFLSNKREGKKARSLNFILQINKTALQDFFRSKILFLMQNSASTQHSCSNIQNITFIFHINRKTKRSEEILPNTLAASFIFSNTSAFPFQMCFQGT